MARLFGTDGVRGIANRELDSGLAFDLGQAGAISLSNGRNPRILIGKDTRISCDMLEAALAAGICSTGGEAVLAGVVPTPGIAYLTRHLEMDAGIVISASHNPAEYNGIKFFDRNGYKLPDEQEDEIERLISEKNYKLPNGSGVGRIAAAHEATEEYVKFLCRQGTDFSGLKIVVDCANGSSSEYAARIYRNLGAEVIALSDDPDGININQLCGSTHPEHMCGEVVKHGADIGLAFDGDADRLIACDAKGRLVDGDRIMGICAINLKSTGRLAKDTLVVTVMSNLGLELSMKERGIELSKTTVGDRYVLERMMEKGFVLGGEQSGHVIFSYLSTAGDGMQTGIQLVNAMVESGKALEQLASQIDILPQCLVNAHVSAEKKYKYMEDGDIAAMISELEHEYNGRGRLLIRPSGTEHLVRVMIEGPDQRLMEEQATRLARLMETKLA